MLKYNKQLQRVGYAPRHVQTFKKLFACVVVALLATVASVTAPTVAIAAPNQVHLDAVKFVNQQGAQVDSFTDGTLQLLQVNWSIPGNAVMPISGTVQLPSTLIGQPDKFPLHSADNQPIGECVVSATQITCSITDAAYVADHSFNMSGSFSFQVKASLGNSDATTTPFTVGGQQTNTVTVQPVPPVLPCGDNCTLNSWPKGKGGSYDSINNYVNWFVQVPATSAGVTPGTKITITENWDSEVYDYVSGPTVKGLSQASVNASGAEYIKFAVDLDPSMYTVSDDHKTVSWIAQPGSTFGNDTTPPNFVTEGAGYQVFWTLSPKDGGGKGVYSNAAVVDGGQNPDGSPTGPVEVGGTVTRQGGSGDAIGTGFGRLALTKYVDSSALGGSTVLPESYGVTWRACAAADAAAMSGASCIDGDVSIYPGTPYFFNQMAEGTRLQVTEVTQTEPAGVIWDQKFRLVDAAGNPVDPAGAVANPPVETEGSLLDITFTTANQNLQKTTYYQMRNVASIAEMPFSAKKLISNPDDVAISGISSYQLDYSWTLPGSVPGGTGTLVLPADGEVVQSGPIPVGATVTVVEVPPTNLHGATWADATYSVNNFEILASGQMIEVTVQNTISQNRSMFQASKEIVNVHEIDLDHIESYELNYRYQLEGSTDWVTPEPIQMPANGDAASSVEIPEDATVEILGETPPEEIDNADWAAPFISVSSFEMGGASEDVRLVEVINTITPEEGVFRANKVVDNPDQIELGAGETFTLTYTYTEAGQDPVTQTMLLPAGGDYVLSENIPAGAEVTVEETGLPTNITNGEWGEPEYALTPAGTGPTSFTISGSAQTPQTVTVTNTLNRLVGVFSAQKSIVNNTDVALNSITEYALFYTYSAVPGYEQGQGLVRLAANGAIAFSDEIPYGSVVTLSETLATPPTGTKWGVPEIDPLSFTMDSSTAVDPDVVPVDATVQVANTLEWKTAVFFASKDIVNTEEVDLSGVQSYTLAYTYDDVDNPTADPVAGTLKLPADGTRVQSPAFPEGTTINISEVLPAANLTPGATWQVNPNITIDATAAREFVIDAEKPASVKIVLTNEINRDRSQFGAQKSVMNAGGFALDVTDTYELQYSYTLPLENSTDLTGEGSLTLAPDGEPLFSGDIPHGAEVLVWEDPPTVIAGATWSSTIDGQTVTEADPYEFEMNTVLAQRQVLQITNEITRNEAPFGVLKELQNIDGLDVSPDKVFTFDYQYLLTQEDSAVLEGSGELQVASGADTATMSDPIPHGATVTLTEQAPNEQILGASWTLVEPLTFQVNASADAVVLQLNLVNRIQLDMGTFTAEKQVNNPDSVTLQEEEYVLQYQFSAVGSHAAGSGTVVLRDDGKIVTSGEIPHGAVVTISEQTPPAVNGGIWAEPQISPTEFVMDSTGAEPQHIVVVNTLTADPNQPLSGTGAAPLVLGIGAAMLLVALGAVVAMRRLQREERLLIE